MEQGRDGKREENAVQKPSINGKKVRVVFLDGENHYSRKEGIVVGNDPDFLWVRVNTIELIPKHRIVRIEIVEGKKDGKN